MKGQGSGCKNWTASAAAIFSVCLAVDHLLMCVHFQQQQDTEHGTGENLLARFSTSADDMLLTVVYTVSQKTGPLLRFQLTATILVQYQQILVQRIVV